MKRLSLVFALVLTAPVVAQKAPEPAVPITGAIAPLPAPDTAPVANHLALGNPSNAKPLPPAPGTVAVAPDFNNLLVPKSEFALSFNQSQGGPNWVSWHLAQSDRGKSGRSNAFRPDPTLPVESQIKPQDYIGSG